MPISPARAASFEILMRTETTDAYASELLHSKRFAKLSAADHGLATELVMGVLRWRSLLDDAIAKHSSMPVAKLEVEVLTALRVGAYQLLFLNRIPKHAAVNESVELVKQARKRSAAGMVNGILRRVEGFPHFSQKRGAVGHPILNARRAHPRWLVERWEKVYGGEIAQMICEHNQSPPATVVRLSPRAASVEAASLGCPTSSPEIPQQLGPRPGGQPRAAAPGFDRFPNEQLQFAPGNLL